MIYFIRNGDFIKIGRAKNPDVRLAQLQTAHPHKLALVCTMEGGPDVEKALHNHFAANRANGEWFLLSDSEVFAVVDEFKVMGAATIEEALRLNNWLSILTYDVFQYAKKGGNIIVELDGDGLTLRLPGVDLERVHGKFRRLLEDSDGTIIEAPPLPQAG